MATIALVGGKYCVGVCRLAIGSPGGSVGTPTYIHRNDPYDVVITYIHRWGKTLGECLPGARPARYLSIAYPEFSPRFTL